MRCARSSQSERSICPTVLSESRESTPRSQLPSSSAGTTSARFPASPGKRPRPYGRRLSGDDGSVRGPDLEMPLTIEELHVQGSLGGLFDDLSLVGFANDVLSLDETIAWILSRHRKMRKWTMNLAILFLRTLCIIKTKSNGKADLINFGAFSFNPVLYTETKSASPKYADIFPTYLSVKLKWWLHSITFRTRNLGKNNFYYNEYILNMSILSLV